MLPYLCPKPSVSTPCVVKARKSNESGREEIAFHQDKCLVPLVPKIVVNQEVSQS